MAQVKKAKNLADWFDQRLGTNKLIEVMMTKYWIPKNINWLWAMGVVLTALFTLLVVSGIFLLMYYKPGICDYLHSHVCGYLLWLL